MEVITNILSILTALSTVAIAYLSFLTMKRMDMQSHIMKQGFLHTEQENIKSRLSHYCLDALSIIEETIDWLEVIVKMKVEDMKSYEYKKIIDTKKISKLQVYYNILLSSDIDRQEVYCESIKQISNMEFSLLRDVERYRGFQQLGEISNNVFDNLFEEFQKMAKIQLIYISSQADIKHFFSDYLKKINADVPGDYRYKN